MKPTGERAFSEGKHAARAVGPEVGGVCGGGVECGCVDAAAEDGRRACQCGHGFRRAAAERLVHRDSLGKRARARRRDLRDALFQLLLPPTIRHFHHRGT